MTNKISKVLFVISNLEYGGAQRQIAELFNNIDASKYEMHICSLSNFTPLAKDLKNHDGRLHIIEKHHKYDFTTVFRLVRLLKTLKAKVVVSYLFDADISARLAGKLVGIKVINSERNSNYYIKPVQIYAYFLTKKFVDLWIANSMTGAIFNQNKLKHDAEQYEVIHNGVDTDRFKPLCSEAAKRNLGLAPDIRLIGMFASLKDQKNHPMLLYAIKKVLPIFPKLKLLYVGEELYKGMHGSNEYANFIRSLVDALGLEEQCIFLGNQDDVSALYPACDITVLPSKYEGMPNVILESMACGVPVIATDVSDNNIIIKHNYTGFLVGLDDVDALAERITELLMDKSKRREMGRNAREWVEKRFSSKVLAINTQHALDRLLCKK